MEQRRSRIRIITTLTPNSAHFAEIAESYLDVWGREKAIDPATRKALEQALGRARKPAKLRLEPGRCYEPELLAQGGRVWGFMVQLYGVRSARNWGIGDFGDLRALVEQAARLGASVVGVNPLHAGGASPYSPCSRHALNWPYLELEAIAEFAASQEAQRLFNSGKFKERIEALKKTDLVDHAGVADAKREVLELLYASFRQNKSRRREFEKF